MDSNEFGEFIKVIRDKSLSRPAMAEKTGLHVNTIKGYEQDGRLPDVDYLAQLAIETGHSFADLLNKRLLAGKLGKVAEDQHLMVTEQQEAYSISVTPAAKHPRLKLFGQDRYLYIDEALLPANIDWRDLVLFNIEDGKAGFAMISIEDRDIQDGASYLIDYGTGPVVRTIQFGLAGSIVLVAEGQGGAPLTVSSDQRDLVKVHGKVVCTISYI